MGVGTSLATTLHIFLKPRMSPVERASVEGPSWDGTSEVQELEGRLPKS